LPDNYTYIYFKASVTPRLTIVFFIFTKSKNQQETDKVTSLIQFCDFHHFMPALLKYFINLLVWRRFYTVMSLHF